MIYRLNKKNESTDFMGGKAKNLVKLNENYFNVPNFIVFSNSFFLNLIQSHGSKVIFDEMLHDIEKSKLRLIEILSSKDVKQAINDELDCENDELFAVRSSGNLEDSSSSSFAGIFDSYLNIEEDCIAEKVVQCWLSIFKKSVIEYLGSRDLSFNNLEMNVIVQVMIDSDFSGVIFTRNPITTENDIVIEIAKGLGEDVVSGNLIPFTYVINREEKKFNPLNISDSLKNSDIVKELSSDIIPLLYEQAISIEKTFQWDADIEFAIKGGIIYILQVRPITN